MELIKCEDCGKEFEKDKKECPNCGCPNIIEEKIKCEECGNELSNEDTVCLNCGCPIVKEIKLTCPNCGQKINDKDKKCLYCGTILKKRNKNVKWIVPTVIAVVVLITSIIGISSYNSIQREKREKKYSEAVTLFEEEKYSDAEKQFKELGDYGLAKEYIELVNIIDLVDEEKYEDALGKLNNIHGDIAIVNSLKRFAKNGVNYQNKNYKAIYEDNKYFSSFYNDKEEEIVYESFYQYGKSLYSEGYYGSPKEIFEKIKDYKDVSTILKDKYFGLVGNNYTYSVSSGYTWGYMSMLFYPYGDRMNYNVFTQSLFSTNTPKGYEYSYRIKNNKLIIGESITFDIVSFNGDKLVVKDGKNKFTLTK